MDADAAAAVVKDGPAPSAHAVEIERARAQRAFQPRVAADGGVLPPVDLVQHDDPSDAEGAEGIAGMIEVVQQRRDVHLSWVALLTRIRGIGELRVRR